MTSRRHDDIDDGWLADVIRYGYQIVNSEERLLTPLVKKGGKQEPASWDEALDVIGRRFSEIREKKGSVCLGGLAAPNLDNASLYSFSKFFRRILRSNNVDFRCDYAMLPDAPDSLCSGLCSQPFRIGDIDNSDVIVVFGSDLVREHPNEYLRIRRAYNFGSPRIYSISPYAIKSADVADLELVYTPGTDEHVINGICLAAIEENLVDATLATRLKDKLGRMTLADSAARSGVDEQQLRSVARALADGRKITFLIGELIVRSTAREGVAAAVANLNLLFGLTQKGQLAVLARYANSVGAERLGLMPSPSESIRSELVRLWEEYPESPPLTTDAMMALMKKEEVKGFFILGANPVMLYPDREFVTEALEKLEFLVVCDLFETQTSALADVVLPLASWAEYAGEYINLEGRMQRTEPAVRPIGQARPGFDIMTRLAEKFDTQLYTSPQQMKSEIDRLLQIQVSPEMPADAAEVSAVEDVGSDQYLVPVFLVDDPHHSGHLTEKAASLANFVGEAYIEISADLASKNGISDGEPVRVESEVGKVVVPARISQHLDTDVALIPRNFSAAAVTSLFMRKRRVNRIKITKVEE